MKNTNFDKWLDLYRNQEYLKFNNEEAILWLKVRAISKKETMTKFLKQNGIQLNSTKIKDQNKELFAKLMETPKNSLTMLNAYLCDINNEWYRQKGVDEKQLKEDLYKIKTYEWGGDQNNSLDKHLISRFVKVISKYDELQGKRLEIQANAWNYVSTSWYNNWTSYLIESIFKHHPKVISAVGEIKGVDFFIDDIPMDLKVTFFPKEYMNEKLKNKLGGMGELAWLRKKAKEQGCELKGAKTVEIASEKISAAGHDNILTELRNERKAVIDDAIQNKKELMKWLYEEQGEMRFGAENRLFVILVDSSNMAQSWIMKRAFEQIEPAVNKYLDNFSKDSLSKINFTFKGDTYSSLADVIFVVK
ncbi:MAG: hypothetical protein IJR53_02195 [Bacteroidales bacterium]|nr:hypothetical protein [Bacteroidales bacterium]